MTFRHRKDRGFTIIETSLVLAISGILLIGLMFGINSAVQRQRFTETVDSTQSFLQQQYNESQNVINNRANSDTCDGTTPTDRGASNCLVLGRVIELFDPLAAGGSGKIRVSDVISDNLNFSDDAHKNLTTTQLLSTTGPGGMNTRAVNENDVEFDVPWGGNIIQPKDGATDVNYIAIIRSPVGGELNVYKADGVSGDITLSEFVNYPAVIRTCIQSADIVGAQAELNISDAGSQDGVTVKYDGAVCPPPSVTTTPPVAITPPPALPSCPSGTTGTFPSCVPIPPTPTCPSGTTGTPPSCTPIPPGGSCPSGTTGTPPSCVPIPTAPGGKLKWKPPGYPTYAGYKKIVVPEYGDGKGKNSNIFAPSLNANTDYIFDFPDNKLRHGAVHIVGGRNVVVIGGESINDSTDFFGGDNRALFVWDKGGTVPGRIVHIEGFKYYGSEPGKGDPIVKTDGIGMNAKTVVVQVENTIWTGLLGRSTSYAKDSSGRIYASDNKGQTAGIYSTNAVTYKTGIANKTLTFWKNEHSDMLQPFGGVQALRVDHMTGDTNCQGMFLRPGGASGNKMGELNLNNINLTMNSPSGCAELLWFTNTDAGQDPCGAGRPITLSNVWLNGGSSGRTLDSLVWPKSTTAATKANCPAVLSNGGKTVTWPGLNVSGVAQYGVPPTGNFVGAGSAGLGYVSPGYL